MGIEFVEDPFEVEIKDGNVLLGWSGGERRSVPLRVFRISHARAEKALAEHDAKTAKVIRLPRRRANGHAATS